MTHSRRFRPLAEWPTHDRTRPIAALPPEITLLYFDPNVPGRNRNKMIDRFYRVIRSGSVTTADRDDILPYA
jgi:hypothetical protein